MRPQKISRLDMVVFLERHYCSRTTPVLLDTQVTQLENNFRALVNAFTRR